jgi:peroxiredoxin
MAMVLLILLAAGACSPASDTDAAPEAVPPAAAAALAARAGGPAASSIGFAPIEPERIEVVALTDDGVDGLIETLDTLVAITTPDRMQSEVRLHLWRFANRLRRGTLSAAQAARVSAHLEQLAKAYPAADTSFERTRWLVEHLYVGAVAPNITGRTASGDPLELADYRGKVVVLYFSGQWCGPCRSEYPYQRLMAEVYADRPFAIVGVNSDSLDIARAYQAENGLDYPAFWDGPTTKGPIATRWNVTGWPTIYVLDPEGRIRFVDVRHEDTLKAVAQLLEEIPRSPAPDPAKSTTPGS